MPTTVRSVVSSGGGIFDLDGRLVGLHIAENAQLTSFCELMAVKEGLFVAEIVKRILKDEKYYLSSRS